MTPEERQSLISELRGVVENRDKIASDVRAILAEEIPKAVAKAMQPQPMLDSYLSLSGPELRPPMADPSGEEGPHGVRYVVGTTPQQAVCRPLKQPLFDTLIVPEEGIQSESEIALFTDRKAFPNGARKLRRHTNMTCDGFLGAPLEYDLSSLELRFEKWSHPDDVQRVLRGLHLTWYFGQNMPWLRLAGTGFKPLIVLPHEVESMTEEIQKQIVAFQGTTVWPAWTHDMKTMDGKARRISSSESFRCGVEVQTGGELHGPVHLKVLMQDTLFAQL